MVRQSNRSSTTVNSIMGPTVDAPSSTARKRTSSTVLGGVNPMLGTLAVYVPAVARLLDVRLLDRGGRAAADAREQLDAIGRTGCLEGRGVDDGLGERARHDRVTEHDVRTGHLDGRRRLGRSGRGRPGTAAPHRE